MIRLRFTIPIVLETPTALSKCPFCGSGVLRHQKAVRGLTDIRVGSVTVVRYKCKACGRTFTHRPCGVTRSSKSTRVRAAAVVLYLLGLSYDAVAVAFNMLAVPLSKTSVYNYVKAGGSKAAALNRSAARGHVRFVGADTTGWKVRGKGATLSWVIDLLAGKTIAVEFIEHEDALTFQRCIENAVGTEFELLTTDEAGGYAGAAQAMGKPHQLCQAHFKKALYQRAKRILKDLPNRHPEARQIRNDCQRLQKAVRRGKPLTMRLLGLAKEMFHRYKEARPPTGGQRASSEYRMRILATDLVENGVKLFQYRSFKDKDGAYLLDGTNNASERAIGLTGKIRYRIMRGGKSRLSARRLINLHACIRNVQLDGAHSFDMAALVA